MPALILMYHDVAEESATIPKGHRPYVLRPAAFREQMHAVAATAVPVLPVSEWCASPRPCRAIVLTFDDGHVSNYEAALPILLEHRLRATFFVTAGRIGTGETMNWQQIRALRASGMEIGSHTLTHRPPATLDDDALRYELVESRHVLEDGLGEAVTSISSPTGFFNPRMRALAREAGYRALCFGLAGLSDDDDDPLSLKRIAVKRSTQEDQFNALLRFDDRTIRRLQMRQGIREIARKALGPTGYLRLRRILIQGRHGLMNSSYEIRSMAGSDRRSLEDLYLPDLRRDMAREDKAYVDPRQPANGRRCGRGREGGYNCRRTALLRSSSSYSVGSR